MCFRTRLAVAVLLGIAPVACGGNTQKSRATEPVDLPASGTAGSQSTSAGGQGGAPAPPAPSIVRHEGAAGEGSVDPNAIAECWPGFHGFQAVLGDKVVTFHAFVSEPGDYVGDSIELLWLEVSEGRKHYLAACCTSADGGQIELHVDTVEPRFTGQLEAVLDDRDDPNAEPLQLSLSFDIAPRAGCP